MIYHGFVGISNDSLRKFLSVSLNDATEKRFASRPVVVDPACLDFLSRVPSVWDETRVLKVEIGDDVLAASRSGADSELRPLGRAFSHPEDVRSLFKGCRPAPAG